MNNTKKQTKKENKITLLEEYKNIGYDVLENYYGISEYHDHNNNYRNITNGYGVELELENDDYEVQDKLSRFLNYKFKMNIEEDSSVDYSSYSMECISQPYTRKEWIKNKNIIKEFFELINYEGLYESDATGLHVHISKELFGKTETIQENNINKLILILENFKNDFIKFSRRTNFNYCSWYSSYNYDKPYKDLYEIQKKKSYSHNVAINRDNNTYEIRIFKGTTDPNEFIATLQLVFNLVDIVQLEDLTSITFNDIINYNKDFKELIAYCKENNIKNGAKIIDKTKLKEILQLKENTKILKENYKYNRYIDIVRTLINNNMELYQKSKEDYKNNSELYNELNYIYTKTYRNNTSIYYQVSMINELLSNFKVKTIYDYKTNEKQEKRVFNQYYKDDYKKKLDNLIKLIADQGGEV